MHVLEYLHRNVKTVAMPTAMVVGALLCRPVTALEGWTHQMITPSLIFLMLFVTFCRVKPRQMKPSMLHFWLLLFQVVVSVAVYFLLLPLNPIVAQGAMICVLAPVAMAAVVIAGMLGANVPTMATYSLVCNMVIALVAPVVLSLAGTGACSFTQILARIAPLLIMPFAAAQFCRFVLPGAAKWIGDHSQISFYMWLVSLVVIIGRTTAFILDLHDASPATGLWLAFAALVICLVQFKVGRSLGRRYGDAPAGGQSLGQKNTVLAVWMAQSFLDPISSIAPTAYIVWQNFVNSYQIWKKDKESRIKLIVKTNKQYFIFLCSLFSCFPRFPVLADKCLCFVTILLLERREVTKQIAIFAVVTKKELGYGEDEANGQVKSPGANPVQAACQRQPIYLFSESYKLNIIKRV